jgi:putative FmdB family regulatory protein
LSFGWRFEEMPIYEYKCRKCGRVFEMFQKITDAPASSCQYCKGPVKKLMSQTTFHLKGSGWYVTDYGGKKAPKTEVAEAKESTSSSDTSPSDSAKTESSSSDA